MGSRHGGAIRGTKGRGGVEARRVALGLAVLAASCCAACAQPPRYDLRRILFDEPSVLLEAGGVARPGIRLGPDAVGVSASLQNLAPGRIEIHAAPSPEAALGGRLEVEWREDGWRSWVGLGFSERCVLEWGRPGLPVAAPWQACAFEVERGVPLSRLLVRRAGEGQGDILLSEGRVEGAAAVSPAAATRPHVVVLLLDAARFDMLRPFRPGSPVGEHLERLAHDGVTLLGLRSSSSWTRPAVASLFTGLRADRHRVEERGDVLSDGLPTVAGLLQAAGYSTAAWSANPNVLPTWGLARGFDAFVDLGGSEWTTHKTDGRDAVSRLAAALAVRGPEPGFYYLHLMDPHAPYEPSAEDRGAIEDVVGIRSMFPRPLMALGAPQHREAWGDYMGEMLDADRQVGAVADLLRREGLYDDTVLLVVADHGEEFLDHGSRDHGRTLHEEVLHVPAILKLPRNLHAGQVMGGPASIEDLMPTLLAAAGLEPPAGIDGRVLRPDLPEEQAGRIQVARLRLDGNRFSCVVDGPWKLIRNDATGAVGLYDLGADPEERTEVGKANPDVVARLSSTLGLAMGRDQSGWHVEICGTADEAAVDLVVGIDAGGEAAEWYGFEPGEFAAEAATGASWRLTPTLTPRTVERILFGRRHETVAPEHVELRVPAGGKEPAVLEVRAADGSPVDVQLGGSTELRSDRRHAFSSALASARVQGGRDHDGCLRPSAVRGQPPAPAARPWVRVWFVPPQAAREGAPLDPALEQRLKALGYLQ